MAYGHVTGDDISGLQQPGADQKEPAPLAHLIVLVQKKNQVGRTGKHGDSEDSKKEQVVYFLEKCRVAHHSNIRFSPALVLQEVPQPAGRHRSLRAVQLSTDVAIRPNPVV